MTYSEALALKNSLTSDSFTSSHGNRMTVCIVPATPAYLGFYKARLPRFWISGQDHDRYAKKFAWDGNYTLYGIRKDPDGKFSGGILDFTRHPELLSQTSVSLLYSQSGISSAFSGLQPVLLRA
jgi:hypothetical protein